MSLTSYRAAPPRVKPCPISGWLHKCLSAVGIVKEGMSDDGAYGARIRRFRVAGRSVLCRPGNDLLSRALRQSTIGAEEFNGRVRDGIGFRLLAIITRPAKNRFAVPRAVGDAEQFRISPSISLDPVSFYSLDPVSLSVPPATHPDEH